MHRRDFIGMTAGALAAGAVYGCAPRAGRGAAAAGIAAAGATMDAATFHASRQFVSTPFGEIAYIERGAGEAALFLHGFPLNSFQWRGALDRLSPVRRCIAPDFMGLGYTEAADRQSVAPDAQASMILSLLDALGVSRVDLVASDSGGAVAQLIVAGHPDRVRTLILTNCDAEIDSPPPALLPVIEMSRAGTFVDRWLARWLDDKGLARSADAIGGRCYADPAHPTDEAIECYFGPIVRSPRRTAQAHAYAVALERNPLVGIAAALARSPVPARIVWGTADTIFSQASPDYLDKAFGNSRGVRRLEGRKLFWPEELPGVIAEEARRLWGLG